VSDIDFITAVLSVPLADPAAGPDSALLSGDALDRYFSGLDRTMANLAERPAGEPSRLDMLLSTLLEQPATVDGAHFSSYEKKGMVYPAIVIEVNGILNQAREPMIAEINERFAAPGTRTQLAELLGTALGVEWVSVFVTFGPSR
jgi:hypothetical protein